MPSLEELCASPLVVDALLGDDSGPGTVDGRIDEALNRSHSLRSHILCGLADTAILFHGTCARLHLMKGELTAARRLLGEMFERLSDLDVGRDALTHIFNRRFLVMANHYMVEPTACSPASTSAERAASISRGPECS